MAKIKSSKNKPSKEKKLILIISLFLFLIVSLSISTHYIGTSDLNDYAGVAKFFAGDYSAKLRASHSVLYGFISSPLLKLADDFWIMKAESLFWLFLLTASLYFISQKNKKTIFLFITAPIIWYMAPWISPAFLISLLVLWAYYFIEKFNSANKIIYLIYSGLLLGFAGAFWTTSLFIAGFLLLTYLSDKNLYFSLIFLISLVFGLLPNLILDQILFHFAVYSISKNLLSNVAFAIFGGAYEQGFDNGWVRIFIVLLFVPLYSWLFYKKPNFIKNKKPIVFLSLSLLFILLNPQIRMTIILVPIIILLLGDILSDKQFKIQLAIFLVITLLVINPYILQIKYQTNTEEFDSLIRNLPHFQISSVFNRVIINEDLKQIAQDYPNQSFVVGTKPDDYQKLAFWYWGNNIKEFISVEDYALYIKNQTAIAGKTLCSSAGQNYRRDICLTIQLRKTIGDNTDYDSINYAISLNNNLTLVNFKLDKTYQILSVYKKE